MIKLENVVLPSLEEMRFTIEGLRNPMNSWNRSDSGVCTMDGNYKCEGCEEDCYMDLCLGKNDKELMTKLSSNGPVHSKYLRMMPVYVRITAPLYWWKEFDTYKVGTVSNSCSTMHKIHAKEFTISDFSTDQLEPRSCRLMFDIIDYLNEQRNLYLNYQDPERKKNAWWQLIQLLPSSYNQTRNVKLNYEVLKSIYIWRKNHKLDEWREFCKWIETLPYSELILLSE